VKKGIKKTYVVLCPISGTQVYSVVAESAAEAKRLVDENDLSIEPVDGIIDKRGRASKAFLDGGEHES